MRLQKKGTDRIHALLDQDASVVGGSGALDKRTPVATRNQLPIFRPACLEG